MGIWAQGKLALQRHQQRLPGFPLATVRMCYRTPSRCAPFPTRAKWLEQGQRNNPKKQNKTRQSVVVRPVYRSRRNMGRPTAACCCCRGVCRLQQTDTSLAVQAITNMLERHFTIFPEANDFFCEPWVFACHMGKRIIRLSGWSHDRHAFKRQRTHPTITTHAWVGS